MPEVSALFLGFVRCTAFFVTSPFPGQIIPPTVRVLLSAALAFGVMPVTVAGGPVTLATVLAETVVGLSMGFLLMMVLNIFSFAGEAAGTQMGLGALNSMNVAVGGQVTVVASSFTTLALIIFALSGGPERLLMLLARSLELLPPGTWPSMSPLAIVTEGGRELFVWGVRAASPVIAAVFLAQVVLAILARAVPTLNLFVEGPALTVSTGILGLIASIDTFSTSVTYLFEARFEQIAHWVL